MSNDTPAGAAECPAARLCVDCSYRRVRPPLKSLCAVCAADAVHANARLERRAHDAHLRDLRRGAA